MTPDKRVEEIANGFESWDSFYSGLTIEQETEYDTAKLYQQYITEYIKDALTQHHQDLMSEVVEKLSATVGAVDMGIISREQGYSDLVEQLRTIIKSTPPIKVGWEVREE